MFVSVRYRHDEWVWRGSACVLQGMSGYLSPTLVWVEACCSFFSDWDLLSQRLPLTRSPSRFHLTLPAVTYSTLCKLMYLWWCMPLMPWNMHAAADPSSLLHNRDTEITTSWTPATHVMWQYIQESQHVITSMHRISKWPTGQVEALLGKSLKRVDTLRILHKLCKRISSHDVCMTGFQLVSSSNTALSATALTQKASAQVGRQLLEL